MLLCYVIFFIIDNGTPIDWVLDVFVSLLVKEKNLKHIYSFCNYLE